MSRTSVTSAMPWARPLLRAGPDDVLGLARTERPACSPRAQRRASARLLLPEPLGPTTALIPTELDGGPLGEGLEPLEAEREEPRRREAVPGGVGRDGRGVGRSPPGGRDTTRLRGGPVRRSTRAEALDGLRGGGCLGLATRRALALTEDLAVDPDLDAEGLLAIGPDASRSRYSGRWPDRRCVYSCNRLLGLLRDMTGASRSSSGARGLQPVPDRPVAEVQVEGAGQRLERRREEGRPRRPMRCDSPSPRRSAAPSSMRSARRARPGVDTMAARRADSAPSSSSGWRAYSASEMARFTTASPRYSRRSL